MYLKRPYLICFILLSQISIFSRCFPAQSPFPIVNRESNARVTLLESSGDGSFSMNVELFWSFLPGKGDGTPEHLILFFQNPKKMHMLDRPTITHCRINDKYVQCSEWDSSGRFVIPLSFPLYPGTRLRISFHFSFRVDAIPSHGIMDHFFPKIPAWHQGEWIAPNQYSTVFPYGTCHIISTNPQAQILIPDINRRDAKQNTPPAVNGCSMAFSNEILKSFVWQDVKVDYDSSLKEKHIYKALEEVSKVTDLKTLPQIILLRGPNHAGWGICSVEDPKYLQSILMEMILKMYYPLMGPSDLNLHADLTPFLIHQSPLKWVQHWNQWLSGTKTPIKRSRFSYYMANLSSGQRKHTLSRWLDDHVCQILSIEDLLRVGSKVSNEPIDVQFSGLSGRGYKYVFNSSARLSQCLILKTVEGTFYLKNERTMLKEIFPAPLVTWYSGFSMSEQGDIHIPAKAREAHQQSTKQRRKLWESTKWQWFF